MPSQPHDDDRAVFGDVDDAAKAPDATDVDVAWPARTANDIIANGVAPVEWDIEGLVTRNDGPVLLYGPPGSLKSWIVLHASLCMVTGEPFLGRYPVHRRSCATFLNFDAGAPSVERRIALLGQRSTNFELRSPDAWDRDLFRAVLERNQGGFVSVDCFADVFQPDGNTDPAQAIRAFLRDLRRLYADFGCNGFLVDHSKRPNPTRPTADPDYYGSVQKKGAIRQMWSVAPIADAHDPTRTAARIACEKPGDFERWAPFIAELEFSDELVRVLHGGSAIATAEASRDAMLRKVDAEGPVTREQMGATGGKAKIDFDALLAANLIAKTGRKVHRKSLYWTPERIADDVQPGWELNPVQPDNEETQ